VPPSRSVVSFISIVQEELTRQAMHCTYSVTLTRARVTIVAVENNMYYSI
jgi:hypothetical protein